MVSTLHNQPEPRDSLVRGGFTDNHTDFTVRASSATAPDSFQVIANGNWADIVLIVSGLNSGQLHATWGDGWRVFNPEWKLWVEDAAFKVFYNADLAAGQPDHAGDRGRNADSTGRHDAVRNDRRDGGLGPVRFCNG
jgi:hypothetical protein